MSLRILLMAPAAILLALPGARAALDLNANQQSDVWESRFNASGLLAATDCDNDGFSNAAESIAGTDPFSRNSSPVLNLTIQGATAVPTWSSVLRKRYQVLVSDTLAPGSWLPAATVDGTGATMNTTLALAGKARFFRLSVADLDSDGDGLSDWEEQTLGFDLTGAHTERLDQTDLPRVQAGWPAANVITVVTLDGDTSERWPDPGVIAIRRSGGLKPLVVNFTLGGTATSGPDYTPSATTSVIIPAGAREAWVTFSPIADAADGESTETITLTAQAGAGYTLGSAFSATVNLANETTASPPSAKAAARFLVQAAFGPDQDSAADADIIPENVEAVISAGFSGWLDQEFAKPPTYLQPFTIAAASIPEFYLDTKVAAWWNRAMGVPTETPGGPAVQYDVLRQRVAFCLSQIVVVSDRPETLAVEPVALANYYDMIVSHAFGNYRDLLYDVTRHPVMGFYLSALKNQKPDPANNIFPDENYAREIMQLFSIGLWELNPDGTRKKDAQDRDIPTYTNATITNFARVFTGLSYAGGSSFLFANPNWTTPMQMWDAYHDMGAKTLLNGVTLAANPPSGLADLDAAIDNIFNHPNVGPFIGRLLIQRLVTSNPSPAYIGRVSAAFANNGQGVRGDMKAVIRAILLDDEARNPSRMADPTFGKQREPFLRVVNFARAFNASAPAGFYQLGSFYMDHYEEPFKSPSVFNFYLPGYTPPGEIQAAGLVAPEFQILNATSSISTPNYYYNAILGGLHRWGSADPNRTVKANLTQELALVTDPDALIRRLDLGLTGGQLSPAQFQIIREAVLRIGTSTWDWQNERVKLAVYLVVTSPEFCILR